jgi:iron complex transport system permease protein
MQVAVLIKDYRHTLMIAGLGILLLAATLLSFTVGAVKISIYEVIVVLGQQIGLFGGTAVDETAQVVMTTIRIPRIVMTLFIGAALGISGASLQGLFRNPLVEPALLGVSGGSAVAVVLVIVAGTTSLSFLAGWAFHSLLSLVAFAGGVMTTVLVVSLSLTGGRTNVAILILVGVAINALTGALTGLLIFYASETQLSTFIFWTLGNLGGATWEKLWCGLPMLGFSIIGLLNFARSLNAIALGEAEAYHLGVDVERVKRIIILLVAMGVGVSVALAGTIGFIGLIIPHLIRTIFHADNQLVLPAAALGGALLLILADIISRTIVAPAELPIGVVTALMGAPFFVSLLLKSKSTYFT